MFVADGAGGARFVALPPPTDDEVAVICARAARRIRRLCRDLDGDDGDDDHATAALLTDAARAPLAPAAGLLHSDEPRPRPRPRTAAVDDFTLHADTAVLAHDRTALERLLRYRARPPSPSAR